MFVSWDIAYLTGKQCKQLQKLQFRFKWFPIGCFQRPLEICALDTKTWMHFFSMWLLDYDPPLLSRQHKCSVTIIFSGSPSWWFRFNCESFFLYSKVWLSWLILDFCPNRHGKLLGSQLWYLYQPLQSGWAIPFRRTLRASMAIYSHNFTKESSESSETLVDRQLTASYEK